LIPDPGRLLDRLLPKRLLRSRLQRRFAREVERLVMRNGENLRWAIMRGLDDTYRAAVERLEERLDDAIAGTRGVIGDAVARRRDQSFRVDPEIGRLTVTIASLQSVVAEIRVDGDASENEACHADPDHRGN
jgi:hypothetical protein